MEHQNPDRVEAASEDVASRSWLDQHHRVRNVLALIIVSSYVIGLAVVALVVPLVTTTEGTVMDNLQAMSSIFSGLVGMVVGYYFGKS